MIDATFTKISKIWVQFVIKMTLKFLCFVRKIMHRKKNVNFSPPALVPACSRNCLLFGRRKKRERNIFASQSFILLITGMGGTCVSGGSFHEDNGLHLLLPASEEDRRRKHTRKSFVNFKMPPKC